MPYISKNELYKVTAVAILVLAISCLPYALGYGFAPPGWDFGGFIVNAEDSNTYLAAMQQGAQGAWLFRLLYTSEDHPGAFLYLFYLLLGHLSALSGLPLILTYHLARLFCGLALLMVAYFFIAFFIRRRAVHWIAYLLVCLSSGLGWLVLLISPTPPGGISPIDFWLMDAYTFFTILLVPHFCLGVTLLLLVFVFMLDYFHRVRPSSLVMAVVASWLLAVIHPYLLLIAGCVLAGYWLLLLCLRRRLPLDEAKGMIALGCSLIPPLSYYYWTMTFDPVMRGFSEQDITMSPPPSFYILGYGLVFLLAIGGFIHILRQRRERELFLSTWVMVVGIMLYFPFKVQRRSITGLHIPLCILASLGLIKYVLPTVHRSRVSRAISRMLSYDRRRLRLFVLNLIVVATFPSNLYLLASSSLAALQGHPALFHTETENEAIDWLADNSQPMETILCSYWVGNYIPARIGHRVFLGHWDATIDYTQKRGAIEAFFQSQTDDSTRLNILQACGIAYLFYGPQERALGDFNPASHPYLVKRFSNDRVSIYATVLPADCSQPGWPE
ncbi:MAG: hypothetical protein ACETWR_00335 [Anaerolineae bacterium]